MSVEFLLRFGLTPKAALLSHSNFGSSNQPTAIKMRKTLELLRTRAPWLEVDGEMHGDLPLDGKQRAAVMPTPHWRGTLTCSCFPTSTLPSARLQLSEAKQTLGSGARATEDGPF